MNDNLLLGRSYCCSYAQFIDCPTQRTGWQAAIACLPYHPPSLLLPAATRQQQTNLARTPSSERPKKRPTDPDKVAQRCFTTQSCCYNLLITFYHLYVSARLFVQSLLIFPPPVPPLPSADIGLWPQSKLLPLFFGPLCVCVWVCGCV